LAAAAPVPSRLAAATVLATTPAPAPKHDDPVVAAHQLCRIRTTTFSEFCASHSSHVTL
jgi:hypothetical protein